MRKWLQLHCNIIASGQVRVTLFAREKDFLPSDYSGLCDSAGKYGQPLTLTWLEKNRSAWDKDRKDFDEAYDEIESMKK